MTATTSTTITAVSFPTPDLARRSTDPAELRRVTGFAQQQADAATAVYAHLAAVWSTAATRYQRMTDLRGAHAEAVAWRHQLALQAPRRLGQGIPHDASRFVTPIDEASGPNYDRLGYLGRLKSGSIWDAASRLYVGGESTPAHEVMLRYGQAAVDRIDAEAPGQDVLFNVVTLPGGHRVLAGNRLVRGAAARKVADELVARVAARGRDTSTMEVGGDLVYAVTGTPVDSHIMFDVALSQLAGAPDLDPLPRLRAWQDARYLLYQAPRMKKGSDAVTRVFLVAVGALLFGRAPVLQHDVDLRCMVLGQAAATEMDGDTALVRPWP